MSEKPLPGSIEEIKGWINLVTEADESGTKRTHIGFGSGWRGMLGIIVTILVFLATMAQGIEATRSFSCNMHWISSPCSNDAHTK